MIRKKISFFLFSCLLTFLLSQPGYAQHLDSILRIHGERYQPERVSLHYDKSAYAPGETVWFKAYLMDGIFPAEESKSFYIDWVDDKGTVLEHTVWPLVDGMTTGQFDIPATITGNALHVRGYTRWMLNFDSSFLYSKDIRLLQTTPDKTRPAAPAPSIQFFPEGGDAVAGVLNTVAFKANDQYGRPVKVNGILVNEKGEKVQDFRSVHDGMGSFSFYPQPGSSYMAKWKDEKGIERTTSLPPVKPSGLSMQVVVANNKRVIALNISQDAPEAVKQVHLIGTMNGRVAFRTTAKLTSEAPAQKVVPTNNLPSGVLTITVFDAGWNALAERITFINNNEYSFQTAMQVEHWGTSKRGKNEISISLPDSMFASLSVSVTDADLTRDSSNIISELLLTGQLKGDVHKPAYYFSRNNDTIQKHLDLVMLTHGWRRFQWEGLVKGKLPALRYPRDSVYMALSGQLYGIAKNTVGPADHIIVLVKDKDSSMKMSVLPIAPDGTFRDQENAFFGQKQVHYQISSKGLRNAEVRFMTDRFPALNYSNAARYFQPPLWTDTSGNYRQLSLSRESWRLEEMKKSRVMENITVTARTKSPVQVLDDKYTSGLFRGADALQFDLVNNPTLGYMNIFQFLQGRVAGLQITSNGSDNVLTWRGGTPSLFLDEMQVDEQTIGMIPVNDIAYVKVFRPPFIGGAGGGSGGGIAIYTKKGDDAPATPGKGLDKNTILGYTPIRQFYSPDYSRTDPQKEEKDLRTTLYWNPMLQFDPRSRKALIRFYNNDVSKSFRIVIQGMSRDGLLTSYEEIIE